MIRRAVQLLDERTGAAPLLRKGLRYVFPDHWSFLLGEVAVYSFMVLVGTGVYITLFFEPSYAETVYHGSYEPLQGFTMSEAYKSVLEISFDVKAGLLMRQTHHWAANVFVAAIVVHLLRVFFTGAYRKPPELTWVVGLLMLFTTLLEGYLGYSLIDDLLSGMGLAIGYAVAESLPLIGADLALGIWGAPFPGDPAFEPRMYIFHVLILPVAIGTMIAVHLSLVASHHHTQFRRTRRQSERKLLGSPLFPAQVPRSLGLLLLSAGLLFLLGGLVQINPIWEWGPYDVALSTNGAQPDWYLGWLIGSMRLVPGFDVTIGEYTLVPNPFWGGALFPLVVFLVLGAYPWVEKRIRGERGFSNVLDRPRDRPGRTAFGAAFFIWVALVLFAGSADRVYVFFGIVDYVAQVWVYRAAVFVVPIVVYFVTKRVCKELQRAERIEHASEQAEAEARAGVAPA
ncbi:MAG: cytochrome b N-terminal domain-containing protein [Actinomycetota bacterium]|nr:cytochrome b N-terminal domain-containing protein [Actinomycetota bacterium]